MPQSLTAAIAWRYLRKEKVKGAVGTISTVSVCAMAVATAAIICVLSVFNGFRDIISGRLDALTPDVMISPAQGKVFKDADSLASRLSRIPSIAVATPTLSDNALIITDGHEMPVTIKGIKPGAYSQATSIKSLIDEHFGTYFNPASEADDESVVSIGVAARMKISDGEKILIFTPKREGRVNMANPAASFISDSLKVRGIYRSDQQEFDENGILAPISMVRRLLQYDTEASAIEIKTREGYEPSKVADNLRKELGDKFIVKDRYGKNREMGVIHAARLHSCHSQLQLPVVAVDAGDTERGCPQHIFVARDVKEAHQQHLRLGKPLRDTCGGCHRRYSWSDSHALTAIFRSDQNCRRPDRHYH